MLAEVWRKGLYHRIASIFIEDGHGRMLLQLRGPQVGIYPNCWDQAAGGHVDKGQTYKQAALNETAEELGLRDVTLKALGTFRFNNRLADGRIINQFERVFLVQVPYNTVFKPEPEEISKLQWFELSKLKTEITQRPEAFTPGLRYALGKYFTF